MEPTEPVPYKEAFPVGATVRIADSSYLEEFKRTWQYHHKLSPGQLRYANTITTIKKVSFYHGGDAIYELTDIPGLWLEPCLRPE